jgi:zinc protease
MGGNGASKLYQKLVVEKKIAVSFSVGYSPSRKGPATVAVYAIPAKGVSLEKLEKTITAEMAAYKKQKMDEGDLARLKKSLRAEVIYAQDSVYNMAHIFGEGLAIGRSGEEINAWPDRIQAVTSADIEKAKGILNDDLAATAWLVPVKSEKKK